MTFQEILEDITRHRANPLMADKFKFKGAMFANDVQRKIDEIEWALQALAEKLRDEEAREIANSSDSQKA